MRIIRLVDERRRGQVSAGVKRDLAEKGSVPLRYWALWWTLMMVADVLFYVILTPFWMGLRAVAWLAEMRSSVAGEPSTRTSEGAPRAPGFGFRSAREVSRSSEGTMADIALAFAVLRIGSRTELGYVIGVREVPMVVLLLLGGVWADRLPRALVLVGSDTVRGVAQAATAAMLLTGHASIVAVALVQILYGGANAFGRPAYQGLIPQVVSAGRLQQANALLGLSYSTIGIAGAALGGVLVATINPRWALAVDAATFAVSALLLLQIRLPAAARMAGTSILADFREGWASSLAGVGWSAWWPRSGSSSWRRFRRCSCSARTWPRRSLAGRSPGGRFSPWRPQGRSSAVCLRCACDSVGRSSRA